MLSRLFFAWAFPLAALTAQAAEFVRAFGTFPTDVIPLGMVAGADGYFYGFSGTGPTRQGASFRVASDQGKFELTHQFKAVSPFPAFNRGGSMPGGTPLFATGCTYGFAKRGGLYGHGVLFQVWMDRTLATIDLDPSQLPPDLPTVGETFVDSLSGLFEGPDRSLYSYHLAGGLIRIERNGMISKVASVLHPGTARLNYADPHSKDHFFSVSTNLSGGSQNRIHLLRVRLSDGVILKETGSQDFAADPNGVTAIPSDLGLLVHVADSSSTAISGKLYRFDEDSGALVEIATFGRPDNPALPPRMRKFIHAGANGTLYYSTGSQRAGIAVEDGRTLIELKPDGSFRTICGFGGYAMFNMVAKDGYLFGATHGTEVYLPKDQGGYDEEWMAPANAANYEIVKGSKKGGFHFQVAMEDPDLLNPPLVAVPDLIQPGLAEITIISPLRNDRGPGRRTMQLLSMEDPQHGYFYDIFDNKFMYRIGVYSQGNTVSSYLVGAGDSQTATGTIMIQGTVASFYRDPELPLGRSLFSIGMKKSGVFSAKVPTGSGNKTVKVTGKIDWRNQGLAGVRLPRGEVITLYLDVKTPFASPAGLDYRIRQGDGTVITGRALRGIAR